MLKHHIWWQVRKWWPLLLIFSIVLTVTFTWTIMAVPMTANSYNGNPINANVTTGVTILYFTALGITFVMSLFVFNYRTKRQSADIYYQAAYAPTTIKRVRLLIGLAIVILSFTAAFLLGSVFYLLRYFSTPEARTLASGTVQSVQYRLPMNWGIYFVSYFFFVIVIAAQYLINCFLVGLGDYVFDQICLLLFGNVFLALIVTSPLVYFLSIAVRMAPEADFSALTYAMLYSLGPVGPAAFGFSVLEPCMRGVEIHAPTAINSALSTFVYLLEAGGALAFCLLVPDPSGEHADHAGARNKGIALIPHGAAAVLGFLICALGVTGRISSYSIFVATLPIFGFILYGVGYYAILALWRHSFKTTKFDLICYLCVVGTNLILLSISFMV